MLISIASRCGTPKVEAESPRKQRGLYIIGSGHDRHHDSVVILS